MNPGSLGRRCGLWLLLAAFAACLNPQPDDNPMARPRGGAKTPAAVTGSSNSGPESPLFDDGDPGSPPANAPAPPSQEASPAAGGGTAADAGPAPDGGMPEDDAGSLGD